LASLRPLTQRIQVFAGEFVLRVELEGALEMGDCFFVVAELRISCAEVGFGAGIFRFQLTGFGELLGSPRKFSAGGKRDAEIVCASK
jgi:hypothetical protein